MFEFSNVTRTPLELTSTCRNSTVNLRKMKKLVFIFLINFFWITNNYSSVYSSPSISEQVRYSGEGTFAEGFLAMIIGLLFLGVLILLPKIINLIFNRDK